MNFAPNERTLTKNGTILREAEPPKQKRDFPKAKGDRAAPAAKQFDPARAKRPAKA
jgi:hypothetical protein